MYKRILIYACITVPVLFFLALFLVSSLKKNVVTGNSFLESSLDISSNNIIDVGVVDFNNDYNLDIFSTAHHSRSSLLLGSGTAEFKDVLNDFSLSEDPLFSDLEISSRSPSTATDGFYIYWLNSGLVLKWKPVNGVSPISGGVYLSSSVSVKQSGDLRVNVTENVASNGLVRSEITFSGSKEGSAVISTKHIAIPVLFNFSSSVSPKNIFVGQKRINPTDNRFQIFLGDRHGMAWADHNSDGLLDVYITRGGLKGLMPLFDTVFYDELFLSSNTKYINTIDDKNIIKNSCPAYNVQWVDYNNDGFVDLYIACHHGFPNQLHENLQDGTFKEVATLNGIDHASKSTDTPFAWLDVNNDSLMDLVIAKDDGLFVLVNTGSRFELKSQFPIRGVTRILINDYDSDGDLDLFTSSYFGMNTLLAFDGSDFVTHKAPTLGLPPSSLAASWVDYDNDGLIDLHLVPGGLYRQTHKGKFEKTSLLSHRLPWFIKRARSQWFDADNDGDLDLVLAVNYQEDIFKDFVSKLLGKSAPKWIRPKRNMNWDVRLFSNNSDSGASNNDWLQLEVVGIQGNSQSIGTTVDLVQHDGKSTTAQVGQFDTSAMSQGHYRLYFGLGRDNPISSVNIRWADGVLQEIANMESNQLKIVEHPKRTTSIR